MIDEKDPIISASEISQYVYCNHAWWLRRVHQLDPGNQAELAAGEANHRRHGRRLFLAGLIRYLGYTMLAIGLLIILFLLLSP